MKVKILYVDLFCGAGGVTTGIHDAVNSNGELIAEVVACVNHDENAILSHFANHPETLHFIEDIRTIEMSPIIERLNERRAYWESLGYIVFTVLWASLECTNFSNAKGGMSRDADSRTLAEHLFRYLSYPYDFIKIENVREFMGWGPLDENGRPESKTKGSDYQRWVDEIKSYGYNFDYRILNSADYGANTSRRRFFGCFAKEGLPIKFPAPTHSKNPENGLFANLKKWNPVKECLDFSDEGKSIFERKKPLSDKTLERIYAGLIKYVAGGKPAFIAKYYSGNPKDKVSSIDSPAGSITCIDHHSIVRANFLTKYHGNGENILSENDVCSTLTTKDRLAIINPKFILNYHHSSGNPGSIEEPCCTIIARQDKAPLYLTKLDHKRSFVIHVENFFTSDYDYQYMHDIRNNVYGPMVDSIRGKIVEFMFLYGISDIKMRMLKVVELLTIQGFPEDYILIGNQTDQKKFIGNSVVPKQARVLTETMYNALIDHLSNQAVII